jgi:hypothetical protein
MLLIFKIFLAPIVIALISIAGRIWGTGVSGLLAGLPIIIGPILVFLDLEKGDGFAIVSSKAAILGVISIGVFCYAYAGASKRLGILGSIFGGLCGFGLSTYFFSFF